MNGLSKPKTHNMQILTLSGSARLASTNSALLRGLAAVAPKGMTLTPSLRLADLPIFNPDLEPVPPLIVQAFAAQIAAADGVVIASPEYVRTLPGGLKNAIDWLVSRPEMIEKPIALIHASHRGDDMLDSLRAVLNTVTQRFAADIFLRLPLTQQTPDQIAAHLAAPPQAQALHRYLLQFRSFIQA